MRCFLPKKWCFFRFLGGVLGWCFWALSWCFGPMMFWPHCLVSARFCLVEYPGEMWFQSKFYKAFFLWTYLMIFVSFAEAVSMYLVFFQEQRKTFLPLEKQYVIIVRKRSVAFSRKFFFWSTPIW